MAHEDESRPEESTSVAADDDTRVTPGPEETGPIRMPGRQPAFGPDTVGSGGGPARGWGDEAPTTTAAAAAPPPSSAEILDRPMDDTTVAERLNRPGMARSTRILLLVLGAVVFLGLGLIVGRATAPATGPGSVPNAVGTVEAVDTPPGGSPVVTVRAADGTLTALQTTPGTIVATPAAGGNAALRVGSQVTVTAQRDQRGETIATRVDLPAQ
jgi:hypothetical protein